MRGLAGCWCLVAALIVALTPQVTWAEPPPAPPAEAAAPASAEVPPPEAAPAPEAEEVQPGAARGLGGPRVGRRAKPKTPEEAIEQGYIDRPEFEPPGSMLGGLLASVPGFLIHGVGHYYMGERETALALLIAEVVGVAALLASAFMKQPVEDNAGYGAPRQWLLHTGIMLFSVSWLADIVGAFKGSDPLTLDEDLPDRNRVGLSYRYNSDPLTPFAHYIVLWYELNAGRFFVRPLMDLEVALDNRRFLLDVGGRLWQPATGGEHIALGVRLRREETRIYGYAVRGYEGYAELRLDIGRMTRNLKGLYLTHRMGLGSLGYQFTSNLDSAPSILSAADFTDTYLSLSTGLEIFVGRKTRSALTYVQDPTAVVAPVSPETGVLEWALVHRYDDSLDVSFAMTMGQGYVAWLGVIFR
ncbi:MAG: hypothetical protein ACE366_00085 [Bradymonadia bacterium]